MNRILLLFCIALLAMQCTTHKKKQKEESKPAAFVKVKGTQFTLNDKPYYFTGTNLWHACYLGSTPEGQQRLLKELDTLEASGLVNLRILGASEKSDLKVSLAPAIQTAPGIYDKSLLKGLDFVLAEMGKRNMHAVVYLNNYWQWSGGMAQYVNWVTGDPIPDPDVNNDWHGFMAYSARFYSTPKAVEMNRNYIKMLINRKNTYSGLQYKNDPAIMAWQLSNEPRPGTDDQLGEDNMDIFVKWIDETSGYIKSLDTNHLVSAGSEGTHGCLQNKEHYFKAYTTPNIDYLNVHLWPKNWGWFDCNNIEATLDSSIIKAKAYLQLHYDYAAKIGKPITLEEFGMDRDNGELLPGTPVSARNTFYKSVLNMVYESASQGSPIAGTNIWAWAGYAKPTTPNKVMGNVEAYLGDPLGEAQGLNTIFVQDTETLDIIHKHSQDLKSLMQ